MKANRSIMGLISAILAAAQSVGSYKLDKLPAERIVPKPRYQRLPGMSPAQYFRNRAKAGRPKRHKNRANCARLAKVAKRKAP